MYHGHIKNIKILSVNDLDAKCFNTLKAMSNLSQRVMNSEKFTYSIEALDRFHI